MYIGGARQPHGRFFSLFLFVSLCFSWSGRCVFVFFLFSLFCRVLPLSPWFSCNMQTAPVTHLRSVLQQSTDRRCLKQLTSAMKSIGQLAHLFWIERKDRTVGGVTVVFGTIAVLILWYVFVSYLDATRLNSVLLQYRFCGIFDLFRTPSTSSLGLAVPPRHVF